VPSTIASLLEAAALRATGMVPWGAQVAEARPGVYAVALTEEVDRVVGVLQECPVSLGALETLMSLRPELRVDGQRPTVEALAARLRGCWLPDEVVLYIGKMDQPLRQRVGQYYRTVLGAKGPHAGGWFIKTLGSLAELRVHYVACDEPEQRESMMLTAFVDQVSPGTRAALHDPDLPVPFANLELHADGRLIRKRHGISGAKGSLLGVSRSGLGVRVGPGVGSSTPEAAGLEAVFIRTGGAAASMRSGTVHRTQPVTEADLRAGSVRIPIVGSTKRLFPTAPERVDVVLRGRLLAAVRRDPRFGPDRERSGVIGVGRDVLRQTVSPGEVLEVRASEDGTIHLD
jgi:hypothetical protein